MTGWINYYGISTMKSFMKELNGWLKRRLRQYIWEQWKKPRTRCRNLIQLGIDEQKAYEWSNTRKGYWRISASHILHRSLIDEKLRLEQNSTKITRLGQTSTKITVFSLNWTPF